MFKLPSVGGKTNVIHDKTALNSSSDSSRFSLTVSWKIYDRCTYLGAEHDALTGTPQYITPDFWYEQEEANNSTLPESKQFEPEIDFRCFPVLWRSSLDLSEIRSKDGNCWKATTQYEASCAGVIDDQQVSQEFEYSIVTSRELKKIPEETRDATRCLTYDQMVEILADPARNPDNSVDFKNTGNTRLGVPDPGGINVTHDGEVKGVQVPVPKIKVRARYCFPPGALGTCTAARQLISHVGCVNSVDWGCPDDSAFPPGDVQLQGFSIRTTTLNDTCPINMGLCNDFGIRVQLQAYGEDVLECEFEIKPGRWLTCGVTQSPTVRHPHTGEVCQNAVADRGRNVDGPTLYENRIWVAGFDVADVRLGKTEQNLDVDGKEDHRTPSLPEYVYVHRVHCETDFGQMLQPIYDAIRVDPDTCELLDPPATGIGDCTPSTVMPVSTDPLCSPTRENTPI